MLALGRSARHKEFSKEELEKLISIMRVKIISYQYIDLSYTPQKGANPPLSLSTLTYTPVSPENTPEQEEDMSINDEKVLSSTATELDTYFVRNQTG